MKQGDIIKMAIEARLFEDDQEPLPEYLEQFANAVAVKERERILGIVYDIVAPIDESAWIAVKAHARNGEGS